MKIEEFTEGQIELLKALCQGCNVALYRGGLARLRDQNHNPLRNLRSDMWEKVKDYCELRDGLWWINPVYLKELPTQITKS